MLLFGTGLNLIGTIPTPRDGVANRRRQISREGLTATRHEATIYAKHKNKNWVHEIVCSCTQKQQKTKWAWGMGDTITETAHLGPNRTTGTNRTTGIPVA